MSFPVCKFFKSEEGCKFGNKCRFRHLDNFSPPDRIQYSQKYQYEDTSVNKDYYQEELSSRFDNLSIEANHGAAVRNQSQSTSKLRASTKICQYYDRTGTCCFGNNCRFIHIRGKESTGTKYQHGEDSESENYRFKGSYPQQAHLSKLESRQDKLRNDQCNDVNNAEAEGSSATVSRKSEPSSVKPVKAKPSNRYEPRPDKICQFYKRGWCNRGKRCRFLHHYSKKKSEPNTDDQSEDTQQNEIENDEKKAPHNNVQEKKETQRRDQNQTIQPTVSERARANRPAHVPQAAKKLLRNEIDDLEASKLRRTEIDQLMKRFPRNKVKVNRDCAEYFECIIDFSPTDPDWVSTYV